MKEYTIKEGNHYCFHPIKFHWEVKRLIIDFMFTDSCAYDLGTVDQFDWNKVFGIGFGFSHHKNSYRIGSCYDVLSKRMQLAHYSYNKGRREYPYMCAVELNQQVRSIISFSRSTNTISNRIVIFENGVEKVLYEGNIHFDFTKVAKWGVVLFPFFGGDRTALHDMKHLLDYKF